MRIQFKKITLENFRSFEHAEINLEGQGITIVRGFNQYEDNASSNGSGKSSIFEAIIYAIFDETSFGEKDVANRIVNAGFCVILDFAIDGINYTIQRQMKSNKTSVVLYKDSIDISCRNKTDTNKLILSLLNVSKSIFLDSIFLSQGVSTNLASLSPTARKERLETLTNTDTNINVFKEKIKSIQLKLESSNVELKMQISRINGNNESLEQQLIEINKQLDDAERKRREKEALGNVDSINQKISECSSKIQSYRTEIENLNAVIEKIGDAINHQNESNRINLDNKEIINSKIQKLRDEYNEYQQIRSTYSQDIAHTNNDINRVNNEIKDIQNSDICPVCKRKYENVNEEHIKKLIDEKQSMIVKYQENIQAWDKEVSVLDKKLEELKIAGLNLSNTELANVNTLLKEHASVIKNLEDERNDNFNRKNVYENDIHKLQDDINTLNNNKERILSISIPDVTPIQNMLKQVEMQRAQNNKLLADLENSQDRITQHIEVAKNMLHLITTSFRTYLLQNSIKFLNQLLLNYSSHLFSNEQDIIRIEEADAKLDIYLGNASYESLSGGEKTRVNIALLLAQKALANSIGNTWSNIIILDEVLGFCDSYAEEKVIELIIRELDSLESIFMISHKELPIGYDNIINVIKDERGISHIG